MRRYTILTTFVGVTRGHVVTGFTRLQPPLANRVSLNAGLVEVWCHTGRDIAGWPVEERSILALPR